MAEIGQALKQTEESKELRNMSNALINYYKDYQNTSIKHDDVNVNEIEYMIELTSLLMKFSNKVLYTNRPRIRKKLRQ